MKIILPYDSFMIRSVFGDNVEKNVTVQHNATRRACLDSGPYTFQYLKNSLQLKLNNSQSVSCWVTSVGTLAIYNLSPADIDILNNCLRFLMAKLKVNSLTYQPVYFEKEDSLHFFRYNRESAFWDCEGNFTKCLPKFNFKAFICLRIMGLEFYDSTNKDFHSKVKLVTTIDQLVVTEIDDELIETQPTPSCVFQDLLKKNKTIDN